MSNPIYSDEFKEKAVRPVPSLERTADVTCDRTHHHNGSEATFPEHWPVLGICGYHGSGKTTLIEKLVLQLRSRRLAVAVVKHDAHGMTLDTPGKDTDRLFRAGATVFARDPGQVILRRTPSVAEPLRTALELLLADHDLVLVEGHKRTPLPAKVWLESSTDSKKPIDCGNFEMVLRRDVDRPGRISRLVDTWLPRQMRRRPLRAGLLIGGASARMGQAKQLMVHRGRTWADRVAEAMFAHTGDLCLLGDGEVSAALGDYPRLPDSSGLGGPVAGMMSALRWDPEAAWIFVACDMPLLTPEAVGWMLDQRSPGSWAVIPRRPGASRVEPLGAWYDPRMQRILARSESPGEAAAHTKVVTPEVPAEHASAWRSFNTPADLESMG